MYGLEFTTSFIPVTGVGISISFYLNQKYLFLLPSSTFSSTLFPPPEAVLSNNNNDDISTFPANLGARIDAFRNGRDDPDLVARVRNSVDIALEAAVAVASNQLVGINGPLRNRRETLYENDLNILLPNIPRLIPIDAERVGAADIPPQAAAPESSQAIAVANVRPGSPFPLRRLRRIDTGRVGPADTPPQAAASGSSQAVANARSGTPVTARIGHPTALATSARSSGSLPIRVTRPTLPTSTPSSANRSATIRLHDVSLVNAVQPGGTSTQSGRVPPSITVTAKKIPRPDGDLQYHITNSAGLIFGNDVLPHVMEKVITNFRRAHALALHRNEEIPTEVTFLMQTP